MSWLVASAIVFLLALLVRARRRLVPRVSVEIDDQGIRRRVGEAHESVRWDELRRVQIVTTDAGPFVADAYWLFLGAGGSGCALENEQIDDRIFARLARLPGVDHGAIIAAMSTCENASFLVWSAPGSELGADAVEPAPQPRV